MSLAPAGAARTPLTPEELKQHYVLALERQVAGEHEEALYDAYRLGRRAIEDGLGVLELTGAHQQALAAVLTRARGLAQDDLATQAAGRLLEESISPFEMTQRSYREANRLLQQLNLSLEHRVDERTRELAEALHRLRRAMDGTIEALALVGEMRDPYTAGHQKRVAQLARAIAQQLGLTEEEAESIHIAGVLHDIGKICVPAEILSKPGKISDPEFAIIKTHPQVGYDMLKSIEFPFPVADIVHQHHERLDGTGYPLGLAAADIRLEAKILSVADMVEAIMSHRPYRPGLGLEKALTEAEAKAGIHLDHRVVGACVVLFRQANFQFN